MRPTLFLAVFAIASAAGCANSNVGPDARPTPDAAGDGDGDGDGGGGGSDSGGGNPDASCGIGCDSDGDGVPNVDDQCPGTPTGQPVNNVGCADSQVMPMLNDTFPPYGLTWTPTGDPGRAGGLLWDYNGIERDDLFHIYWIICDDPATPCGVSLDGPIDVVGENWMFSAADSDLPAGRAVFINTTNIVLADTSTVPLSGRMTVTITDGTFTPIALATVATLGVTARLGTHGAEITGTAFKVTVLIEVRDGSSAWTPYLDYYDAAQTPDPGTGASVSLAGSFYDE